METESDLSVGVQGGNVALRLGPDALGLGRGAFLLSAEEARELAQALNDAADLAERCSPTQTTGGAN
jgi:hypothetical protein